MLADTADTDLIAKLRRQLEEAQQARAAAVELARRELAEASATLENAERGFQRIAIALGLDSEATLTEIVVEIERTR